MPARNRFTIYDMMEAKGVFDLNPANINARDKDGTPLYVGPIQYPKMLYHPDGETRITNPPEPISTPFGPKWVGEKREIISRIVRTKEEEEEAILAGWHAHPSRAVQAGGGAPPPMSADDRIKELESQLARLQDAGTDSTVPKPERGGKLATALSPST